MRRSLSGPAISVSASGPRQEPTAGGRRSRAPRRHLTRGPGPDHGQGDTVAPTGERGSSPSCCDKVLSGLADHEVIRKEPSDPAAPTIASSSARSRSDRIPSLRGEIDSGHQEADAMARRAQCSGGHEEAGEARDLRGRGALPLGRRGTPALAPTNSWAGDGQVLHPPPGSSSSATPHSRPESRAGASLLGARAWLGRRSFGWTGMGSVGGTRSVAAQSRPAREPIEPRHLAEEGQLRSCARLSARRFLRPSEPKTPLARPARNVVRVRPLKRRGLGGAQAHRRP